MRESKLTYIAIALSAGAFAVSIGTAGLSALANSSKIDKLSVEVATLRTENERIKPQLATLAENRSRIDELDIGLTALASVANIDRAKLATAIASARNSDARVADEIGAANEPAETSKKTVGEPVDAPASLTVPAHEVSLPKQAVKADQVSASAASALPKPSQRVLAAAPEALEDNPFAADSGTSNKASGEVMTLAISTESGKNLSIAEVDGILGKRISEKWYKPAGAREELSAIVQVKMSRDGKVTSVKLSKASGNEAFDTSVISAVQSIVAIDEVRRLSDADFKKAYENRSIQFTPKMGA